MKPVVLALLILLCGCHHASHYERPNWNPVYHEKDKVFVECHDGYDDSNCKRAVKRGE